MDDMAFIPGMSPELLDDIAAYFGSKWVRMDEPPDTETKFVFIRYTDSHLTCEWAEHMSPYEAWAFCLEATDMVRAVLDGETADSDDE